MISLKLTGHEDIDKVLKSLPSQLNDKFLREAHERAAKPLVERAHFMAPVYRTGNLAESIGVVKSKSEVVSGLASELGLINVGPRRKGKYKGYAGHLVEYGTKDRVTKKGAERGRMPKKPFMEPAWRQTQGQVLGNVSGE
jgi:hypothetical protein